ncbi:MAG: hypothetical protein ACPL4K_05720, partial [Candidatus Margulisiibacteriota bacterium]
NLLIILAIPNNSYAQVPQGNRMTLGEISDLLPVSEMRSFYRKMEPLMLKIFGPPFSNINLKIEANPKGTSHDTEFLDQEQTLVLAGQAKEYLKNKDTDKKHALEQIYTSMLHELSHAQYYYGNKRVSFHPQWINEGWAKTSEILLGMELAKTKSYIFTTGMVYPNIGLLPYFKLYLDPETVAGTINWGPSKQNTNHGIVYDITSLVHLTLLSSASSSNDNLDFFKTFNNAVYNWVKTNNKTDISLEEYKEIMRQLLKGKTIDGQPAFDWYFTNPDTLVQGKTGDHLGVTIEPDGIVAFAFRRVLENNELREKPISNLPVTIKVKDYEGKEILNKTVTTDQEGNGRISLPKIEDKAVITIYASGHINGKDVSAHTFYFNAHSQAEKLYGVLVNEDGELLSSKYLDLLQVEDDLKFDYKNKGVFELTVPKTKRTVNFNFLGYKQEISKGPWVRMVAIKIPAEYIQKAAEQPESAFSESLFDNTNSNNKTISRKPAFWVGLTILGLIFSISAIVLRKSFKRRAK